jgi:hypothetical protein
MIMTATSPTAKLNKLNNRKSRRDIERELRIAEKGGIPIEVMYGCPLDEQTRTSRIFVETQLKHVDIDKKIKQTTTKRRKSTKLTGADRSKEQLVTQCIRFAKVRAQKLGIPFDITSKDVDIPDLCPVFGTPLVWTNKLGNDTPSLDRFIPSEGYVKGNVMFISMKANRIKSDASVEDLEKLLEWMKKQR